MQWEHDDGLRSSTRRARIVKVDDKKSQQKVDLRGLKNEKPKEIWRPQPFGDTSVPPKDSDGIMIQMGSRSDRTLYLDGGHEKYRPKNTPEGCKAIFNMYGDIIRVFKDSSDIVHNKKINIRIGKGYGAGESGDGQGDGAAESEGDSSPDDKSGEDEKTISIVATDENITITFQGSKIVLDESKILVEAATDCAVGVGGMYMRVRPDRIDLAVESPTEQAIPAVMTDAGPSTKVFANI